MGLKERDSLGETLRKLFSMNAQLKNRVDTMETTGGSSQYRIYTDGVDIYRQGVRGGSFVTDKTITPIGFDGTEDVDWEFVGGF